MPYLYIGQYKWVNEPISGESYWRMPRADIGLDAIDLRSFVQCGIPQVPQGYGLFLLSQKDNSVGYYLGDSLGAFVSTLTKTAVKNALSLGENIIASDPLNILLELFNQHADATGVRRWKPLRGTKLRLAGQLVWQGSRHISNNVAVFQADYRRKRASGIPLSTLRKWTGATMLKLWREMSDVRIVQLLPPEFVSDGWQKPTTIITDSFNVPDNPVLTGDLIWTEYLSTGWETKDNHAAIRGIISPSNARAETPLSTDDHYVKFTWVAITELGGSQRLGGTMRKDNTATLTYYMAAGSLDQNWFRLYRTVLGVATQLGIDYAVSPALNDVQYGAVNDDDLVLKVNGITRVTAIDNIISGNLYTGLRATQDTIAGNIMDLDSFEAGDLGIPARAYASTAGKLVAARLI